jgi:hypothetical protein
MILILDKRSVGIDLVNPDRPALSGQDFEVIDESPPPVSIPPRAGIRDRTMDQNRVAKLIERDFLVSRRQ